MLRIFVLFSSILVLASASGYGGGGGGYASGLGLGGGLGGGGAGGGGGAFVPAAILSRHNVQMFDVANSGFIQPTTIDVPANVLPVNFVFRSASSNVNVAQKHEGARGSFKETASQDDAHILKHTVTKPIIQEVREVISPFRRIVQTVEPVREEIQTLVARGVGGGGGGGGAGGAGAGGFGFGAGGLGGGGAGFGGSGFGGGGYGFKKGYKKA